MPFSCCSPDWGLRACEIVALELDDIDWDNGRITIRCKGERWAQLPLPSDLGEAIALYLRFGRPLLYLSQSFPSTSSPSSWFCPLHHRFHYRQAGADTTLASILLGREHTCSATPWRQTYSGKGPPSTRSANCSAIRVQTQPLFTPRWT